MTRKQRATTILGSLIVLCALSDARGQDMTYADGLRLVQEGKNAEALLVAEARLRADGFDPEGHYLKGRALYGLGRPDDAHAAFANARNCSDPASDLHRTARMYQAMCRHAQALAAYRRGDYDRALEIIQEALAVDPGYVAGRGFRGAVFEARGELALAEAEYRAALEGHRSPTALYALANLLVRRNDLDAALSVFEDLVALGGGEAAPLARAHYFIGESRRDVYDFRGAADHFEKALALDPSLEAARASLETARRKLDKVEKTASVETNLLLLGLATLAVYGAALYGFHRRLSSQSGSKGE